MRKAYGAVDKVAVDFYAHHFAQGERLDAVAALADQASPPKPFGIWEMGNRASDVTPPTQAQVTAYMQYVQSLMSTRIADGKANADINWYDHATSAIRSSADFRVKLWQNLVDATSQG